MKIIDNILDKYYSSKVVAITKAHIEKDLKLRAGACYDDVLKEWTVEAAWDSGNKTFAVPYIKFYQSKGVVTLSYLLLHGWNPFDLDFKTQYGKFLEGSSKWNTPAISKS